MEYDQNLNLCYNFHDVDENKYCEDLSIQKKQEIETVFKEKFSKTTDITDEKENIISEPEKSSKFQSEIDFYTETDQKNNQINKFDTEACNKQVENEIDYQGQENNQTDEEFITQPYFPFSSHYDQNSFDFDQQISEYLFSKETDEQICKELEEITLIGKKRVSADYCQTVDFGEVKQKSKKTKIFHTDCSTTSIKRHRAKRENKDQLAIENVSEKNMVRLDACAKQIKSYVFKTEFSDPLKEIEKVKGKIDERVKAILQCVRQIVTANVKKGYNKSIWDLTMTEVIFKIRDEYETDQEKMLTKYPTLKEFIRIDLNSFFQSLKPKSQFIFSKTYGSFLEGVRENQLDSILKLVQKGTLSEKQEIYMKNMRALLSKHKNYYFDGKIKKAFKSF